jgi:uncharacterized delta-60 repeat protein/prepilin-type N-terminal cleavage/methylation domain-containing protein
MPNQNSKSFTLIELLIVLALISILATILILTINPGGIFSKARDTKRINDLKNIEKIMDTLYSTEYTFNELNYVSPNVIYISLKDSSSTCGSWLSQLPSLPSGWSYRCSATPTNIDGTGWIPIPFNNFPILNISQLFIDPINKPPYYYTFVFKECNEFTALLEKINYEYIISCSKNRLTPISRGTLRNFLATIGGDYSDYAYSIQQTSDGGYIMAGRTSSFGAGVFNVFIVKLDSSGNLSWAKTIGGADDDDEAYSIQQTSDGGYIIAGETYSFGTGSSDVFIVKLDSSGNLSWAKTIGGNGYDEADSIQQTSDGGYIMAGYTDSFGAVNGDVFIVKLDSSGNLSWAKTIGGNGTDYAYSIQQTSDGGYIIAGSTNSFGAGGYDFFIVKLDSSGNLSWAKTIGGNGNDYADSIQQTSDGGYIIAGETYSFGTGSSDVFIVKLDSSGNLSWAKTIGGADYHFAYSIQQTSDGGYIMAGGKWSFGAGGDFFIVKLDSSGNLSWAKTIGGNGTDYALSIQQTSDGGYIMAGYTNSFGTGGYDVFIVKLDSSGNVSECGYVFSASPTVLSQSPAVLSPSPTFYTQNPAVFSQSPTVSSLNITPSYQCRP